jgi:tRNA(adenine34) deaminase
MGKFEKGIRIAISEAKLSLKEGNHGFGALIQKDGEIIAQAHDREESDHDSTSHAEINAIRIASQKIGKNLTGCVLYSTHEPCPMCASAIVWSGIKDVVFGYSITESIQQDRKRINITAREIFDRSGLQIEVHSGILNEECGLLYNKQVRSEVKRLRNVTEEDLSKFNEDSIHRRLTWFEENRDSFSFINEDVLGSAYRLLLCRFGIDESAAPVIERDENKILFHSMNFCPTLEACKILDLDTRYICRRYNENSTDCLVKQIDPRLKFERNYQKIRPYGDYCEEMIKVEAK